MIRVGTLIALFLVATPSLAAPEDPQPEPKKEATPAADDPLKTAERIIENARQAGKRLADKDAGQATRKGAILGMATKW